MSGHINQHFGEEDKVESKPKAKVNVKKERSPSIFGFRVAAASSGKKSTSVRKGEKGRRGKK